MSILGIIILAIGVSMDAFAVAICKGTTIKCELKKNSFLIGSWFGFFQGLMTLIGFFFMNIIGHYLVGIKELIIFLILSYVGVSMIIESRKENKLDSLLGIKEMFVLSIATSLDALSIGMTLSLLEVNIFIAASIIAIITFTFSYIGVILGNKFSEKCRSCSEKAGGIILILLGVKIILEYLLN